MFCDPKLENIMSNMKTFCVNISASENSEFKFVTNILNVSFSINV